MIPMMAAASVAQSGGAVDALDFASAFAKASPAVMLVFFIFSLWKNWLILPRELAATEARNLRTQADLDAARATIVELTDTVVKQTAIMTRVAVPLTELVEMKRAELRGSGGQGNG